EVCNRLCNRLAGHVRETGERWGSIDFETIPSPVRCAAEVEACHQKVHRFRRCFAPGSDIAGKTAGLHVDSSGRVAIVICLRDHLTGKHLLPDDVHPILSARYVLLKLGWTGGYIRKPVHMFEG